MRATLPLLAFALAVACSRAGAPRVPAVNPAGFPFYPGSTLLVTRAWHHALTPAEREAFGIVDEQRAAYAGHEVVTATAASFDDLDAWLRQNVATPPSGYRVGLWGNGVDDARERARTMGMDFGVFDRGARDVVVLVVDPDVLQRKAGFVLPALARFRLLPGFLQAPIDEQVRAQTGFSVSEALDPMTPIGAAIDALGRLDDVHARGVIYVDARPAP